MRRVRRRHIFYEVGPGFDLDRFREGFEDLYRYLFGAVDRSLESIRIFEKGGFLVISVSLGALYKAALVARILGLFCGFDIRFIKVATTLKSGLRAIEEMRGSEKNTAQK